MASRRLLASAIPFLAILAGTAATASAATSTATFTVNATVAATCNVVGETLSFGSYDVLSATPRDATMTIQASCAFGTTATMGLGLGSHASGSVRRMADADVDYLTYELYRDAAHTLVWGTAAGSVASYTSTSSAPSNFTVYGRVPALQDAETATYSDSVVITITF